MKLAKGIYRVDDGQLKAVELHVHFVDFRKFGLKMPIYFNVIREPTERCLVNTYSVALQNYYYLFSD